MSALKNFKQKSRLLRNHLANLFRSDVTLSQAYEALAASEGTTWNELSARLVKADTQALDLKRIPYPGTPKIRAVLTTGDFSMSADFDAESWFQWAGKERIAHLLKYLEVNPVKGIRAGYGGNDDMARGVADVCSSIPGNGANSNSPLTEVYRYIGAKKELGLEYGGIYCYIDQDDVLRWLESYPGGEDLIKDAVSLPKPFRERYSDVLDTHLGTAVNAPLVNKICQDAFERARNRWLHEVTRGGAYEYLIERGDVLVAMADNNVVPTSEVDGEQDFAQASVELVEQQLAELGYELYARLMAEGKIPVDEPMLGVSTFGDLGVNDWYRSTYDGQLFQKRSSEAARSMTTLDGKTHSKLYRVFPEAKVIVVKRQELPTVPVQELSFKKLTSDGIRLPRTFRAIQEPDDTFRSVGVAGILEVSLHCLLETGTAEGVAFAKNWIEQNHTFAHRSDTGDGSWGYVLSVEKFASVTLPHKFPPQLTQYFAAAVQNGTQWIMFCL